MKLKLLTLLLIAVSLNAGNIQKPTNLNNFQVLETDEAITVILPVDKFLWYWPYRNFTGIDIKKIQTTSKVVKFEVLFQVIHSFYHPKTGPRDPNPQIRNIKIQITDNEIKIEYDDITIDKGIKTKILELPKSNKKIDLAELSWSETKEKRVQSEKTNIQYRRYLEIVIPKSTNS